MDNYQKECIIRGILAEVLEDILDFPGQRLENTLKSLKTSDNAPWNPLTLIKTLGFSAELPQKCQLIRTKTQFSESLCGFHALFYSKAFLSLLFKAKTLSNQLSYLLKLQSDAQFWLFYSKTLRKLLECPYLDSLDRQDLSESGPLDSSHLDYLLSQGFLSKYPIKTASLFYGYGYFQCGVERVEACESLLKAENSGISVIFLGITSHWMALASGLGGELVLLDSREKGEVLLGRAEEPEKLADIEDLERGKAGKKVMSPAERRVFMSNVVDGRFMLEVLAQGRDSAGVSLRSVMLNRVIFDILRSFEKHVNGRTLESYEFEGFSLKKQEFCFEIVEKAKKTTINQSEKLISWLRSEKPPRVLREDLLEVLKRFGKALLVPKTAVFLRTWLEEAEKLALGLQEAEKPLVSELSAVFAEIRAFL